MSKSHSLPIRVYYEDTDAGKIVYYANYFKFAERARTEMLRSAGFDHQTLMRDFGFGFAVRKCSADYRMPAILDDELEVLTRITAVTGARIVMQQTIRRGEDILTVVDVTLACLGITGRGIRMPEQIFAALLTYVDAA